MSGLAALSEFWDAERDGPDEGFSLRSEVVAVERSVTVVRLPVDADADAGRWRESVGAALRREGRCTEFEEWPFARGQSDGHEPSS